MVSPTVPEAAPASSAPRPMNRLTADDDLFLKAHRIFGSKLLTQIAWRFDRQLSRDAVEALHAQLTQGFLARRVVRSRIPLARPWWAPATASMAPIWETDPVPEGGVLDWLAQQAEVDFDPADGRMWRLSAAPHGTGSLPSLVTSHVGADGGAVVFAVRDAVERISRGLPPDRHTSSGRLVGDTPGTGRLRADLADMRASLRAIGAGIAAAWRNRHVEDAPRHPRTAWPRLELPPVHRPAEVVVSFALADWEQTAARFSGSSNGLMIGTAVGILGRSGRITDGTRVRVDVPWSTRVENDPRGNATTGVAVTVTYRRNQRVDLDEVRASTKAALTAHRDPATTPALHHLQPLQMAVPDMIARRLAQTSKAPVCLCTNLGDSAATIEVIAGVRAREMVMRPIVGSGDIELFRRSEGGLHMAWCSDGDNVTLVIAGTDPDRFPTSAHLRQLVTDEFATSELSPRFW